MTSKATDFVLDKPNDLEEWRAKLVGKTMVDGDAQITSEVFHVKDLPNVSRVLGPTTPATRDYIPNRLNVQTDENDKVTTVYYC
ncbi:hypothetical protein BDB00DRAFT_456045 [Zychaea mexicana]|uniref:uncharacterized protein n=1 Tax=Zychaea mexicana TaxID=64656 RepID=UPI0022FEEE83|nr:uncharacterized protein BDB00DRAFT_456045 [Zychaea mexicana]KAI9492188.1 hypothetical protein BDB00DRAFT_456045 [Zychaea mexicana]